MIPFFLNVYITARNAPRITLIVANLSDPAQAPVVKTIFIAESARGTVPAEPGNAAGSKPSQTALAATVSDAGLILPLALVLLAIGATLTIIRRRRTTG